jgi:hypothetical protein
VLVLSLSTCGIDLKALAMHNRALSNL